MRKMNALEQYPSGIRNNQDPKMDVNLCRRYPLSKMTQASRLETFPCRNPRIPQMCKFNDRFQTYQNWPHHIKATTTEMAQAGFIYLNQSDKVKCFYCNGGLQNWKYEEQPWFEHAKWYPNCEYLLKCQGMEYVQEVASLFPNLQRPMIEDIPSNNRSYNPGPSTSSSSLNSFPVNSLPTVTSDWKYSSSQRLQLALDEKALLKEAMAKEVVKEAMMFGFKENLIQKVVERKLKNCKAEYETVGSLIDDLIKEEKDEEEKEEEESLMSSVEEVTPMETGFTETNCSFGSTLSFHTKPKNIATLSSKMDSISLEDSSKTEVLMNTPHSSSVSSSAIRVNPEEVDQRILNVMKERTCKICLDREIDCLLSPCNHMCCCVDCAAAINKCPICRSGLNKIVKIYRQ